MFSFKNKNQEKFYLSNYFTYKKISLEKYYKEYRKKENRNEMESPLDKIYVYIPFCFCLISKYYYVNQLENCLKSIYSLYTKIEDKNDYYVLRDLILFIINSIPIPSLNKEISFILPYILDNIKLDCPFYKGYNLLNTNFFPTFKSFNLSNESKNNDKIIYPLRILLNEKSLIIFDKKETRLSNFCDAFLSLLYPFDWIYTYIPILNEKNIKNINLSSPFLIGANISMIDKVEKLLKESKLKEEVFLLYVYDGYIDYDLGSSLNFNSKNTFDKYFKKTVTDFPDTELFWGIASILKANYYKTLKPYSTESKIVNRSFQNIIMEHYIKFILYIEKTKEKKRKLFYYNLSKTKLFENYIKNKDSKSLEYFRELLDFRRKNKKKGNINYDFNKVNKNYLINPYFSSIKANIENIKDLQKFIKEKYPEDKKSSIIFENNVDLKINDFQINNDKIYLFDESDDINKASSK